MKERILTGWTARRIVFLTAGLFIVLTAVIEKDWAWLAPGIYFMAMGLFAFGCASGNCVNGSCGYKKSE